MMRLRGTTWLAWALWAVWVVLFAALLFVGTDPPFVAVAATLAMMTVGALVASRRPANPIGWIFCAIGLGFMVGAATLGRAVMAPPATAAYTSHGMWLVAVIAGGSAAVSAGCQWRYRQVRLVDR